MLKSYLGVGASSTAQIAVMPVKAMAAAWRCTAELERGETILIQGRAGGVAGFARSSSRSISGPT
jgi:hypothetical protein